MLSTNTTIIKQLDIDYIKTEFQNLFDQEKFQIEYYIDHKETIIEAFGKTDNKLLQQKRVDVKSLPIGSYIKQILETVYSFSSDIPIYLVRAYYPIGIHADAEIPTTGKTIIIPLTFDNNIKTLVFKKTGTNNDVAQLVEQFSRDPNQFKRLNLLSKKLNLKNCWLGEPNLADCLELDDIAEWNSNTVIMFDRMQFHGSNNYKKIVDFKDYVLVHTN